MSNPFRLKLMGALASRLHEKENLLPSQRACAAPPSQMWISWRMFESFCRQACDCRLHRAPALNDPYEHCNHSQNQQNVDKPAECVRTDHTQQPKDQEQDRNRPDHS
jgi:hypothetical protein